jgi:hypothetical protein
MILAIDPGNTESGWCLIDGEYKVIAKGKDDNDAVLDMIDTFDEVYGLSHVVIEMIASYGMAVGQTVFDTCVWVGRFMQEADHLSISYSQMYRKDIKMNLCGQTRAKDSNIRQALVDRFSYERHAAKGGKGVKADPGFFFGFSKDMWAAYAVGVTYLDMR